MLHREILFTKGAAVHYSQTVLTFIILHQQMWHLQHLVLHVLIKSKSTQGRKLLLQHSLRVKIFYLIACLATPDQ